MAIKNHDSRAKINKARLTGRDTVGGRLLKQMEIRVDRVKRLRDRLDVKKIYDAGIWFHTKPSRRDRLVQLAPGSLALGEKSSLTFPALSMSPTIRVAVRGPNGGGKSTLVRHILSSLSLPEERVTYLPQEMTAEESRTLLKKIRRLPRVQLGYVMTVVSRLGSRPQRLLETESPSPGETRKLLLALGLARSPWLIVADEPTNHLDLVSIRCLEDALTEDDTGPKGRGDYGVMLRAPSVREERRRITNGFADC